MKRAIKGLLRIVFGVLFIIPILLFRAIFAFYGYLQLVGGSSSYSSCCTPSHHYILLDRYDKFIDGIFND
jgi:hypothetical protein